MRFLIFFLFSLSFQSSAGEKIPAENDSIIQYFNDCENPKGLAKGFCEARYKLMRNAIEERKKELMKRIDQAICDHDLPAIIRVLECSGFDINIQIPDYKRNQETKNGNYTVGLLTRASDEGFWEGLQYFFDKKVLVDKYKIFRVIKNTVEKDAPFELFELLLKSFNPHKLYLKKIPWSPALLTIFSYRDLAQQ